MSIEVNTTVSKTDDTGSNPVCGTNKPSWVQIRESLRNKPQEELEFIGESGADGVIDGLLPNGLPYEWKKRRK